MQFRTEMWIKLCVWGLFLATVACYFTCHNRVVLAHPFWALATFPICCSVFDCGKNRTNVDTGWSSRIWKKYSLLNKICTFHIRGLHRTNRKICEIVTLYHWELLKKRPSLGIFSIQSVMQGFNNIQMTQWRISLPWLNEEYFHVTTPTANNTIHTNYNFHLTAPWCTLPWPSSPFCANFSLLDCSVHTHFPLLWRHVCSPPLLRLRLDWPAVLSVIKLKAVNF
jgi:hypothetical protein